MPYSDREWLALSRCAPSTGEEFDWFALDIRGHLAVFTTAGMGPVPAVIWANREKFYLLETAISGLVESDTFKKVLTAPGNHVHWFDFARKGLFAFDYHDVHRTNRLYGYDLIAQPGNPVPASQLMPQIDFRWLPVLKVEYLACTRVPDLEIVRAEPAGARKGDLAICSDNSGDDGAATGD